MYSRSWDMTTEDKETSVWLQSTPCGTVAGVATSKISITSSINEPLFLETRVRGFPPEDEIVLTSWSNCPLLALYATIWRINLAKTSTFQSIRRLILSSTSLLRECLHASVVVLSEDELAVLLADFIGFIGLHHHVESRPFPLASTSSCLRVSQLPLPPWIRSAAVVSETWTRLGRPQDSIRDALTEKTSLVHVGVYPRQKHTMFKSTAAHLY